MFKQLSNQKKSYWFWVSAGGLGLLLCVIFSSIAGLIIYGQLVDDKPVLAINPTATQTSQLNIATPSVQNPSTIAVTVLTTPTPTQNNIIIEPTQQPPPSVEPQFGPICFTGVSNDGQTFNCDTNFPPTIVEIHAIFEYSAMTPQQNQWTRLWYHNGQQVLRVEEKWAGDIIGQFDYNLNTTDGQPLSIGTWELELYVDGQLQTYGAFVVEATKNPIDTAPEIAQSSNPLSISNSSYKLAFTKWDGSKHAIWVANLDGSNQQFLLDFAASPAWSPDGQQIAFFGEEGIDTQESIASGTNGVWVMGAYGEQPTQLLPEGSAQSVRWSPQGNLIAFDGARGGPNRRIYFIDPYGTTQPLETLGEQVSFDPMGNQIIVKVCRPECGLWITNKDDSNPRQLTTNGSDGLPAWSPDGTKIAFSRDVEGNVDVYTINVDGTNLQQLTNSPGIDSVPTWTPDSQQIAFRTTRNGAWQIFIMTATGLNQQLVIDNVGASNQWAFDRMSIR